MKLSKSKSKALPLARLKPKLLMLGSEDDGEDKGDLAELHRQVEDVMEEERDRRELTPEEERDIEFVTTKQYLKDLKKAKLVSKKFKMAHNLKEVSRFEDGKYYIDVGERDKQGRTKEICVEVDK
ncbi:hypothetical protein AC579_5316 [Pseudocercospora musae]|uniref:Uncharacterized protein n=1 Tax=Pseudocercospora musae TaxID=113226 RepID=A0A139HZM7_9PEZI|nr:hypothetical protein AC579_5316 [Pseudocercospora musae]